MIHAVHCTSVPLIMETPHVQRHPSPTYVTWRQQQNLQCSFKCDACLVTCIGLHVKGREIKSCQDKLRHWKSPLTCGDLWQGGRTSVHPGKHVQLRTEMKDWRPQASWINDESRWRHYVTVESTSKKDVRKMNAINIKVLIDGKVSAPFRNLQFNLNPDP